MASNKLQRINEDIQYALSELVRSVKDPRVQQGMISITGVDTTGDLKYCKVYLSVLGLQSEKELMKGLKSASGYLRRELGQRVKLRNVPELIFQLDRSIEYGAHINEILNKLDIPEDTEDDGGIDG
ncbi:MAG: 30S ribosome-binding factor RbfA [Oscillospiraceae bacterium]|nr:30S ribosome-binding factor RbfA [Oscillospiraceae bacterium]